MAGPTAPAECAITTTGLNRVIEYEPRDLTISVEAGLPWRELTRLTAQSRLMVPLDPPFGSTATVGGVIASNGSGPRRRLYGTARDLVIGMKFATLEGKTVQSGGMVVKNVAGLDMAKLMIGSFGTLAAIAVVNLKLAPAPEVERSFLLAFGSVREAVAARNRILASVLQPAAIDLLNHSAAAAFGTAPWLLAIRTGGNQAAAARYQRELAKLGVARRSAPRRAVEWHRGLHPGLPRTKPRCGRGARLVYPERNGGGHGLLRRPGAGAGRLGGLLWVLRKIRCGGALDGGCRRARLESRDRVLARRAQRVARLVARSRVGL
jgi:glycolate oxidase FAD binding subunit